MTVFLSLNNPCAKPLAICVSVPNSPFYTLLACNDLVKRAFLCIMIQFESPVGFGWKVYVPLLFVFSSFSCFNSVALLKEPVELSKIPFQLDRATCDQQR